MANPGLGKVGSLGRILAALGNRVVAAVWALGTGIDTKGTVWLSKTPGFTGEADTSKGILSMWFRVDANDGISMGIYANTTNTTAINRNNSNQIQFALYNNALATLLLGMYGDTALVYQSRQWHHLLASWDLGVTPASHLYLDDVDVAAASYTEVTGSVDWDSGNARFFNDFNGGNVFDGAVNELYFNQAEYLDFSNVANRRLFIDANGEPVDLGSDGSTPTGTAPIIFLNGGTTDFADNLGTGGAATVEAGTFDAPSTAITAHPVDACLFDGTNDYMERGADLTGAADGTKGFMSVWIKPTANAVNKCIWSQLSGGNNRAELLTDNRPVIRLENAASTVLVNIATTSAALTAAAWNHLAISWDLTSTATVEIAINGTNITDLTTATLTAGTVDYTKAAFTVGARTAGANKMDGDMAELYVNTAEYLDMSNAANIAKFRDASNNPVFLKWNGSGPTGTAPIVYLNNRADNMKTNKGTGGNFTVTGALTESSTFPSD